MTPTEIFEDRSHLNARRPERREPSASSRASAPFLSALAGLDEARAAGAALNGEGTYGSWVGWAR
jgi:hypothetical protein